MVRTQPMRPLLPALLLALLPALSTSQPASFNSFKLACGGLHCLLTDVFGSVSGGTIAGFGANNLNQAEVPCNLTSTSLTLSVAAGGFFSCALHRTAPGSASTTVTCWGGPRSSDGSDVTAVPPDVASDGGLRAVAAGGHHACAISNNGSVTCWGSNAVSQVSSVPMQLRGPMRTATASLVAAGGYHTCAVTSAGVACWGRDDFGQVSGVPPVLATAGSASSTLQLTCGGYHCCAWDPSLGIHCWGASQAGQTNVSGTATPQEVTKMCAGAYHTCALTRSYGPVCFGDATASKGASTVPQSLQFAASIVDLSCAWYATCVVANTGSTTCWGGAAPAPTPAPTPPPLAPAPLELRTGPVSPLQRSGDVASGALNFTSGNSPFATGALSITTGSTTIGSSGPITIRSGNVAASLASARISSGGVVIRSGSADYSAGRSDVVLAAGLPEGGGPAQGSISLLAPQIDVFGDLLASNVVLGGAAGAASQGLTLGNVTLTGARLRDLLALLPGSLGSLN